MPIKAYYNAPVSRFLEDDADRILGVLTLEHHHALEEQQRWAWLQQISILKVSLAGRTAGRIFLEFYIPRMGKRADAVLIADNIVFVLEFKAGASEHTSSAYDQVEERAEDRRKAEIQHKKLSQDLADWSNAETLRHFVQRLETEIEKDPTQKSEFAERWIDWVKRQAESLDPFSRGVEDFLDHYQQFGWDKMTRRR